MRVLRWESQPPNAKAQRLAVLGSGIIHDDARETVASGG
jgi:hypothetical protein